MRHPVARRSASWLVRAHTSDKNGAGLRARPPCYVSGVASTEEQLRELVEQHVEIAGRDEPLGLKSLELVMLVEAIEDTFGLRVAAADVTPENFGTLARIVDYVQSNSTA